MLPLNKMRRPRSNAHLILCVETFGLAKRLMREFKRRRYYKREGSLKLAIMVFRGRPSTGIKRVLAKVQDNSNCPIAFYLDGDGFGLSIFLDCAYGVEEFSFIFTHKFS